MMHNLQIAIELAMASMASTVDIEDGPVSSEPHGFYDRLKSGTLYLYSTKSTWNYTNTSNTLWHTSKTLASTLIGRSIYNGRKETDRQTHVLQCSPASVGLTQARLN